MGSQTTKSNMRGWIIYIFLAACCVFVSGKQETDRFKQTITTRRLKVKVRCTFSLVVVGRKVLRRKSKVSCKKIKQDTRVKNYKISSPVSGKTFILTLFLKKKGGKAVLRKGTVRPGKPESPPPAATSPTSPNTVLLIGPSPELEVLTLPSLSKHSCTPPTHPQSGLGGYIATVTEGGDALVCGGRSGGYKNTCYTLQLGGGWTQTGSMLEPRAYAAAIPVDNGVWVTGGSSSNDADYTATTEVL